MGLGKSRDVRREMVWGSAHVFLLGGALPRRCEGADLLRDVFGAARMTVAAITIAEAPSGSSAW
jgi:hypothetical protein